VTGVQLIIGAEGVASSSLAPRGTVRVGGQLWSAELHGAERLDAGQTVRVLGRHGLTLDVEPIASAPEALTR
jgi:membrane-bound ClpP family serine protease